MSKQIDLKALLESKMGNIEPLEGSKTAIEAAEKKIPHNLMFDAESTVFKPETRPVITSGATSMTVEEAKQFYQNIERFIDECLISGVDYGRIPHCQKPTLLKPGAEKIAIYLGLVFRTEVIRRTEDFQQGFFAYECKSYILDAANGVVKGEGIATANTKETKYAKSNGFSVQNIVLKMCKKRALVDAVLNVAGLSAFFTQDLDDVEIQQEQIGKSPDELKSQTKPPRPVTKKQLEYLQQLMQQHGNTAETMNKYVKQAYGVDDYTKISGVQCSELIEKYKSLEK